MRTKPLVLALLIATPALANHPGENLNQVMAAKEAAFEPVAAKLAPKLQWNDDNGDVVELEQLKGKIAAISFVPADCGTPCSDQQQRLSDVVSSLNASPMREMVEIVTLSDEQVAKPAAFGNWTWAQVPDGQTAEELAATFASGSNRSNEGPMIYLLDRKGQQVGIFHGSKFLPLNLVLYINGLTNAHPHPEPSVFERLFGWLL